MGCDIHGRVQFRWNADGTYQDDGKIEDGRDYRVFAALANVRNGFGFAGVKTHEPLVPISEPRGLPADLKLRDGDLVIHRYQGDDEIEVTEWLGDHSHSWLTLTEILAWDGWHKTLANTGIITADEYARIKRDGGTPESWCGGISGGGTKTVKPSEADAGVPHTHVSYEWETPFMDFAGAYYLWFKYLEKKHGWLMERDPAAVRIVFGFDS